MMISGTRFARQKDIAVRFEATAEGVKKAKARKLHEKKRPVSLLSGLLTCGCCGGRYGLIMRDRYGCLNHHRRGTCDNNRTITREKIEERVLSGLKDRLISSHAVEETIRAFAEEMNRLNRERPAQGEQDRKALEKIEKAIAGIIAAIEDGMYQPSMKARMDELERQKAEIMARQMKAPTDTPDVHPNIASIYCKRVERFTDALHNDDDGRIAAEVYATLRGELFGILDFVDAEHRQRPREVRTKVEARPRNH